MIKVIMWSNGWHVYLIFAKKKTSSLRHALVQAQQEKKQKTKKNQGQKREIRSTAPLRSNGISFDYDYILLVSSWNESQLRTRSDNWESAFSLTSVERLSSISSTVTSAYVEISSKDCSTFKKIMWSAFGRS